MLYFDDDEKSFRLYIPNTIKTKIFKLAYDKIKHLDYTRTHEKFIQDLYIHNIINKLYNFIRYCFYCQFNQTSCHKFYNSLQFIFFPIKLFYTLIIDFILILPKSFNEKNCVMKIIDKFFKIIIFIFGKIIFDNKNWIFALFDKLLKLNWNLSHVIISNRDQKFIDQI